MYYRDTDSINNVLSGQETQRLMVESEKKLQQREYDSYRLMRGIVTSMLLRNSLDTLGVEWSYLFYKELKGYQAPERILKPNSLIITPISHTHIKDKILEYHLKEIVEIADRKDRNLKCILNKLYGRENIYDS